jgi:hypothetical protein
MSLGDWCQTFRDSIMTSSSMVEMFKKNTRTDVNVQGQCKR